MSDGPVSDVPQDPGFPEDVAGPKVKKRLLPPSRIALILLVIATAVVACLELRARWARDASYKALVAADTEAEGNGLSLYGDEVEQHLQGSFRRVPDEEGENILPSDETIVWSGLLLEYRIVVQYRGRESESLSYVTMD